VKVEFFVPGPLVPWMRAQGSGSRKYTHPTRVAYAERVAWLARAARPADWPGDARYRIDVWARHTNRQRIDLDNVIKSAALDDLTGILWNDDSQVDEIHVYRLPPCKLTAGLHVVATVLDQCVAANVAILKPKAQVLVPLPGSIHAA
jgi:Holliday junction resolvase RusA-like endonuclease